MIVYAVIYTDGAMTMTEVIDECRRDKVIPLLVYREVGKDGPPTLVIFTDSQVVIDFMRRNTLPGPDKFMLAYRLDPSDGKKMESLHWKFDHLDSPIHLMGATGIQVGFELFSPDNPPSLDYIMCRNNVKKKKKKRRV